MTNDIDKKKQEDRKIPLPARLSFRAVCAPSSHAPYPWASACVPFICLQSGKSSIPRHG